MIALQMCGFFSLCLKHGFWMKGKQTDSSSQNALSAMYPYHGSMIMGQCFFFAFLNFFLKQEGEHGRIL